MNYEQIVADTDEAIRRAMEHSVVMGTIMMVMVAAMVIMFFVLALGEYRARKAEREVAKLEAERIGRENRRRRRETEDVDDWTLIDPMDMM